MNVQETVQSPEANLQQLTIPKSNMFSILPKTFIWYSRKKRCGMESFRVPNTANLWASGSNSQANFYSGRQLKAFSLDFIPNLSKRVNRLNHVKGSKAYPPPCSLIHCHDDAFLTPNKPTYTTNVPIDMSMRCSLELVHPRRR